MLAYTFSMCAHRWPDSVWLASYYNHCIHHEQAIDHMMRCFETCTRLDSPCTRLRVHASWSQMGGAQLQSGWTSAWHINHFSIPLLGCTTHWYTIYTMYTCTSCADNTPHVQCQISSLPQVISLDSKCLEDPQLPPTGFMICDTCETAMIHVLEFSMHGLCLQYIMIFSRQYDPYCVQRVHPLLQRE